MVQCQHISCREVKKNKQTNKQNAVAGVEIMIPFVYTLRVVSQSSFLFTLLIIYRMFLTHVHAARLQRGLNIRSAVN